MNRREMDFKVWATAICSLCLALAMMLTLAGCATQPARGVMVRVYESRPDGGITSATLAAGERPALLGEWTTTATLATASVRVSVQDAKRKDTIGALGAAGIGALAGWMVLP